MTALRVSATVRRIFSGGPASQAGTGLATLRRLSLSSPAPSRAGKWKSYSWQPRLYHNLIRFTRSGCDRPIIIPFGDLSRQKVKFSPIFCKLLKKIWLCSVETSGWLAARPFASNRASIPRLHNPAISPRRTAQRYGPPNPPAASGPSAHPGRGELPPCR